MARIDAELLFTGKGATTEQMVIVKKAVEKDRTIISCGQLQRAVKRVGCLGRITDCDTCGLNRRDFSETVDRWVLTGYRLPEKKDKSYKIALKTLRGHSG